MADSNSSFSTNSRGLDGANFREVNAKRECSLKHKSELGFRNIPKRYLITLLLFLSNLMEGYVLTNMSVVIVDMTSSRKIVSNNETKIVKAEYDWSPMEKSFVLGMNFVGQILACSCGVVVHKIGGATFVGVGKLGEAIISLTSPFVSSVHVYLFIGHRFALGLFEGLCYVGFADVFARWVPPNERVRLLTLAYLGIGLGIAINYPLSGFFIQHFGWQTVFYISGAIILVWSVVWIIFVNNDPAADRFITEKERAYLSRAINYLSKEKIVIPFRHILSSVPVYALLNEFFISGFTVSFIMLVPLYVKDVHNADIQTVGLISGIPEFSAFIIRPFFAYVIDYLRSKPNGFGIGKIHKILLFWGQFLTLTFFFITAIWKDVIGCVICLTLARISFNLSMISYYSIVIDMAGQYAGFLQSMIQLVRSTTYFLNPILIGLLIPNHTQVEWNIYFFVISFLTMYGVIVFVIFGSADLQPWAEISPTSNNINNEDGRQHIH